MSYMSLSSLSDVESISDLPFSESDFEKIGKLGEGYFSDVFLVQPYGQNQKYVRKQTKPGRDKAQLQNEIEILRNLNHEYVIHLVAEFDNKDAAIFEFCGGGDLSAHIDFVGRLDLHTVKSFANEIVNGLEYLHKRSILHRDLKSENIFISHGHIRISDFGSAVRLAPNESLKELEGSPINCAPEMIKATGYNYPRDWWSVGIIIYHMIVGDVPFFGNDQMEVFIKILTKQPDYPEYVDNHSKMVIDGLLEKEPKRRFSAVEMKNHPWFSSDFESFGHLLEEEEERVSFKLGQSDSE